MDSQCKKAGEKKYEIEKFYEYLIKYIITYPLAAACSVKVKNRSSNFVEEYIFPQLFMQWIRETDDIDGVRYKSSLNSTLVQSMGAINIALPVKKFRNDGLDEQLTAKIGVSDIGYFDVNKEFLKLKDVLEELKTYKNKLRMYTIECQYMGDYVITLMDLCDQINKTYTALMDGDYSNSELIFGYLDNLFDYVTLLKSCHQNIINKTIEKAQKENKVITKETIENHFNEFFQLTNKILMKHAVFHFSFDSLDNIEFI